MPSSKVNPNRIRCAAAGAAVLTALLCSPASAEAVSLAHGQTTLHGELNLAPAANPADGVVLILHGTLASNRMELIETLQTALGERDVSTLAVSLDLGEPGRAGMRDCAVEHRHRHEDAQTELAAWMNWLGERDLRTVTLLGHSRGGNQVAQLALTTTQPLHALVLVAPATYDRDEAASSFEQRHGQHLQALLDEARGVSPETMLDDQPFIYCDPTRVSAESFLSYHAGDPSRDTPAMLADITVPTLVIAGSADTTVPDVAEKTRPHLDEDTRLLVIEDADHYFRDFYAEDIADAVAELLGELRP